MRAICNLPTDDDDEDHTKGTIPAAAPEKPRKAGPKL